MIGLVIFFYCWGVAAWALSTIQADRYQNEIDNKYVEYRLAFMPYRNPFGG